jgi:hypothetical protein
MNRIPSDYLASIQEKREIKTEAIMCETSLEVPLPDQTPGELLLPHFDEAKPARSPWPAEGGTSKGALSLSDVHQKFREYIPRWNQEFAERMRSDQAGAAALFQGDRSMLPEYASIPSAFQREGISGSGIYPIPAIPSLLRLFHSLPLLFQRIARKNSKDKAITKEDQQI